MSDDQAVTSNDPTAGRGGPKCGGSTRSGGICTQAAGWGTPHPGRGKCKLHGGSTRNHVASAERAIAAQAVVTYGLSREIDPRDALLEEVHRTAGAVAYLAEQVRGLEPTDLVWGMTEESDQQATEFPGTNVKREAKPNIWLVLYQAERKHLVDVCKTAIAAGIEERRVRLAESMGGQIAAMIRRVFELVDISAEQWLRVPEAITQAVRELGGPA